MNELFIHEAKQDGVSIFELQGRCTQQSILSLEKILRSFLERSAPECIILDCSQTNYWEKECFKVLQNLAVLFDVQKRFFYLCSFPGIFDINQLTPGKYFNTKNEALQAFQQKGTSNMSQLSSGKPSLTLTIIAGPCLGTVVLEAGDKEIVIGRHSKCALSLPQDIKSSRFHCKVYETNGRFVLEDLQSSNGTFYEDNMITAPTEITDGARFQVGETTILAKIDRHDQDLLSLDSSGVENTWPSLDPALMGGMETVIGIPLSSVLESDPSFKMTDFSMYSSLPEEIVPEGNIPSAQDWSLIQRVIPTLIKRRQTTPPANISVENCEITKLLGTSNACFCFEAVSSRQEKLFVQYSKESLLPIENKITHPQLLHPLVIGSDDEHLYRIFQQEGEALTLPIPELDMIHIGIALIDLLQALHESGTSGFDLSPHYIFKNKNNMPSFAMIPAMVYANLLNEAADIFSLGCLLYQLSTGAFLPYTPIGILDEDQFKQDVQNLSPDIFSFLLEIFKREEQNLEKLSEKLKQILWKRLAPHMESREAVTFRILRMGDSIIYNLNDETISRVSVKSSLPLEIQTIVKSLTDDNFVDAGKEIYSLLYPRKMQQILPRLPIDNILLELDESLVDFPWELAHDGRDFLAHKFAISRRLFGINVPEFPLRTGIPKVFFLSDENSESIDRLEEKFMESFPKAKVKKSTILENHFNVIQNISQNDIFHVSDPAVYNVEKPMNSGWKLHGEHLFRLRFLENAYRRPKLIFHQGTMTPEQTMGNFLALIYSIGIPYCIGTLWEVTEEDLAHMFYQNLFQGFSVEQALFKTRISFKSEPFLSLAPVLYTGTRRSLIGYPKSSSWEQEEGLGF